MKINQKGFANIILIAVIVILVGAVGYFALRQPAQQIQVVQPETNQQPSTSNGTPNTNNPPQAIKISENVFKNATYHIAYFTGKNGTTPKEFTMIDGSAKLAEFTVCGIVDVNSKQVLAATLDQGGSRGVVTVYCNYGTSATDVFLVAFKNLNGVPVQTDVVDLRKHSVLLSRNLFRVGVKQMSLESNGLLTVTALVVPEALRNAPGYQQSATEPVTITYHLDSQGRITE